MRFISSSVSSAPSEVKSPYSLFFDCYDSIIMNVPIHEGRSIRQIRIYIRWRYRLVNELFKESKVKAAVKAKAQGVIDMSNL